MGFVSSFYSKSDQISSRVKTSTTVTAFVLLLIILASIGHGFLGAAALAQNGDQKKLQDPTQEPSYQAQSNTQQGQQNSQRNLQDPNQQGAVQNTKSPQAGTEISKQNKLQIEKEQVQQQLTQIQEQFVQNLASQIGQQAQAAEHAAQNVAQNAIQGIGNLGNNGNGIGHGKN